MNKKEIKLILRLINCLLNGGDFKTLRELHKEFEEILKDYDQTVMD